MKFKFSDSIGVGEMVVGIVLALSVAFIPFAIAFGISSGRSALVKDESIPQERYEYLIESGTSPDVAADIVYGKCR